MPPPDFPTTASFVADANNLLNSANNSIINSFPPYDTDVYNAIQLNITPLPIARVVVPPPVAPKETVTFVDRKTNVQALEGTMISNQGSEFWFKGLKADLDWDNIREDDITLNHDLNQFITPYTPAISGVWRPCIIYTDPISGDKNSIVNYSFSGTEVPCEAGLGLEELITISTPFFKTWEVDPGLSVKIDWNIPKDLQTCSIMGVLFWYRHYDIARETSIVRTVTINNTPNTSAISKVQISKQTVRIDGKLIELKAQHEDNKYTDTPSSTTNVALYGIQPGLAINDYVLVKKTDETGKVLSEEVYKVTEGLWVSMGPKRFLPGVDIYLSDGFFSINYDSNYLVKVIKNEVPGQQKEPIFEYYPKTNLITNDQAKYRGVLTSLVNLSNDTSLEQLMISDGLGQTTDNEPQTIFMNQEKRNKYIGLKNLARMLATGPLVDMAAVYAYNKFNNGIDLLPYKEGNFTQLKRILEDVYGKMARVKTIEYEGFINNKLYALPSGYYADDDLEIKINDEDIPKTNWTKVDNVTIEFNDQVKFNTEDEAVNTITVSKFVYIHDDMVGQNPMFKQASRSLYYHIEDNDVHSIQDNLRIVKTKKDLALALTVFDNVSKNFYLQFNSGQNLKLRSKKSITIPQVYLKLDFESRRSIGVQTEDFWYKQRFNVGGTDVYTKLKVPDDTDFEPGENESLVLSITDESYTPIQSSEKKITIFDFLGFDLNQQELANSTLTSVYDAFGVNQKFYQIIELQKTLNNNLRDPTQTYNLGLINGEPYRLTKRLNDWTFDFDKALTNKADIIKNLNEDNEVFKGTMELLDNRFYQANVNKKTFYPEIREMYFHRLGGVIFAKSLLFTIGKNIYWNYRTAPVPIQDIQYFVDNLPDPLIRRPDKITIEFECNEFLHIRLYDIEIENLRNNKYDTSGYRPFPNKTAIRSDETRVYDKVIGYEYNEDSYLLTTQFSPPIVAYGGHRKETIDALGVNILNHPKPIKKNTGFSSLVEPPISGVYEILQENTLPFTAKNSIYKTNDTRQRNQDLLAIGAGPVRDQSSVKCFLTPQYFYNQVTFTKGFFHPNMGWLTEESLTGDYSLLKNKTPVIGSGISNCKTYGSYGKRFFPELVTDATYKELKTCESKGLTGKDSLLILDPVKEYDTDQLTVYRVWPNIITTNINTDINFISFMSAKLSFLNHAFPKDLKISLFDPREYRFIGGNIVDRTIKYDIESRKCQMPPPPEEEIKKLMDLRTKENNAWIGPLMTLPRTKPRHLLHHTTLLNYTPNFHLTFNNYGRDAKYAVSNDIVLPEDYLDYYIGSSGVIKGFGEFDLDGTKVSTESDNTWGLQISDMGGLDSGSTCFQLQVCTGCPIPNYDTINGATGIAINPYNLLAYNNKTFNEPYPSGYCFIGDFTNIKHLIPPINLEAPYDAYVREFGDFPCAEQPDPPRPREFIKPIPTPEPVFIFPITFPLVGLLVHMSIMQQMAEMGYDMPYGAFGGVYTPNPFTQNVSLKKKNEAYLQNKGYLQIEGTTASYIRGYSYIKGASLSKDYQYGIPNKVELDIQYKDCLWYTVEADIFKYSPQCSPVLDNTKFKYLVYDDKDKQNYPGFDYNCKLLKASSTAPGLKPEGSDRLIIDGARAFYSFVKDEQIQLIHNVLRKTTENNIEVWKNVRLTGTCTISDISVPSLPNPQYVPSVIDNSFYNENNDLPAGASAILTDKDKDSQFLPGTVTVITLQAPVLQGTDKYVSGFINKIQKNTLMLHKTTETENDPIIPFGKWGDVETLNMGSFVPSSIKDQVFSEGSYGWGSDKVNPQLKPLIKTPDLLTLHNFDYHFGKTDYCGRVKITRKDNNSKTVRIKYDPRLKSDNMEPNPYAQSINNDYIVYTGYPKNLKEIKNRIYAHNIFSISQDNQSLFDFSVEPNKYGKYYYDKKIAEYYLPYYDLTLDNSLLAGFLDNDYQINYITIASGQSFPNPGVINQYYKYELTDNIYRWNATDKIYEDVSQLKLKNRDYLLENNISSTGIVQFENIFSRFAVRNTGISNTIPISYNDNYYWISIPADASGVLASSSKIPYSIKQECDYFGANWASLACQNVCNTQMIGPLNPEDAQAGNISTSAQNLSMFYLDSYRDKCPQVNYELRETTQSFYMGCGEFKNDSLVRLDLAFRYYVPETAHAFVSAKDLLENNNNIKVRFKYVPRKIQTDFTMTLGQNAVNQSQLYFWECHETNVKNLYTERTRLNKTPPFYQVLNEMIFRAWFGERQKISTQDTFGVDTFLMQNHYKWVPYEYDNTELFKSERE